MTTKQSKAERDGLDIVPRLYQSEGSARFLAQNQIAQDCRDAAEEIKRLRQLDAARAENEALKRGLAELLGEYGKLVTIYPSPMEREKLTRFYDLLKDAALSDREK